MANDQTVLVIGATGGIGGETALAFLRRGFRIRALHRRPEDAAALRAHLDFDWIKGDAMNAADVAATAAGVRFIVHGANPPMYKNWRELVLPMLESSIAAAKASGARVLFPGTIYNFPADGAVVLHEDTPQRATTRKGAIRIAMERRLEAARAEGVRSLILRAGDFFGPHITANSWFNQLVKPGRPVRSITYQVRPILAIPGPICPTSARPWHGSRSTTQALRTSRCFISRGIGSSAASKYPDAIRAVVAIRTCRSGSCHGGSLARPRPSCH